MADVMLIQVGHTSGFTAAARNSPASSIPSATHAAATHDPTATTTRNSTASSILSTMHAAATHDGLQRGGCCRGLYSVYCRGC
jgi:hypothetical protein